METYRIPFGTLSRTMKLSCSEWNCEGLSIKSSHQSLRTHRTANRCQQKSCIQTLYPSVGRPRRQAKLIIRRLFIAIDNSTCRPPEMNHLLKYSLPHPDPRAVALVWGLLLVISVSIISCWSGARQRGGSFRTRLRHILAYSSK
jgi:hypothetical protein